jgi:hypothetical protein
LSLAIVAASAVTSLLKVPSTSTERLLSLTKSHYQSRIAGR